MNKPSSLTATLILTIFSAILAMASSSVPSQNPKDVSKWVKNLSPEKEKVTKLQFYFHRTSGKTGVIVAPANLIAVNPPPLDFGLVVIKDDPLTLGPDPSSAHIGYAQGISDSVIAESYAIVFTDKDRNGSTLALLGSNYILRQYREVAIVGGTGVFRLARGVVTYRTVSFNISSGDASIEVNAVVFHY